jgi:3-methyladenine DNA glycosylase/8-oxoguanine DNA glycosylase
VARLTAIPGIGTWTAHYIAMRALREPDAFPASDLGLRRAIATAERRERAVTPAALETIATAWSPWRAYAAMHLWHQPRGR